MEVATTAQHARPLSAIIMIIHITTLIRRFFTPSDMTDSLDEPPYILSGRSLTRIRWEISTA